MKIKSLIASSILLTLTACGDNTISPSEGNAPGILSLSGDPYIGLSLTANINDSNGFDEANVTYVWMADGEVISGATSNTYTVVEADENAVITVTATYTDNAGNDELTKSMPTATVTPIPVNTEGTVSISGDAYVDSILKAVITDPNGFGNTPVTYTWMVDGSDVPDSDSSTYTLTDAELGSAMSVSVSYTDNDEFEEAATSAATNPVTVKPTDPVGQLTNVASITDNMTDDAGELRYKHGSTIASGKVSVRFSKDEVMTAAGDAKEAYIALYGSSTSTSQAMVDLRIGNGAFTIRDQAGIDVPVTFTPGDWIDVDMTWDTTNASDTVAPLVTVTINGTSVTTTAFSSASSNLTSVKDGVKYVVFKLSDTSSVVTGAYRVDDFKLYSDLAGTTVAFEDDFEGYSVGDSLDTDNSNSPYNSSTAEAVVAEVEGPAPVTTTTVTKVASITDNMTDDAGELRYKHDAMIASGKVSVRFSKDEVMTAAGDAKEAYIALYGSSTSTSQAMVDLRIGNGTFTVRDQAGIDVPVTFTPGDWIDVEMTWDTTNASDTVAPLVTITINGTSVTTTAFSSASSNLTSVKDGIQYVVFKLSDTSSVVTGAYRVDDFKLYSDLAGTTVAFEDDFESYSAGDSLDTDNSNSPYNSSTAEAVVAEVEVPATLPTTTATQVASITDNMTDDAGELRYKHGSTIASGKVTVSFSKDKVMTAAGDAKEAYIALYGSSTSTSQAMVDLRIGNGTFTVRDQAGIDVPVTFTPGDWIDVEMTWDTTNASDTVAPLVTITINGTSVTTTAFSSASSNLTSVKDGVKYVVFKLSDTSSVVTGAYRVDDLKLYSDLAGTTVAFEDDFEGYSVGDSLDTDNSNSPYNSSTAEAVVAEVTK